jgi:hypothetical protein
VKPPASSLLLGVAGRLAGIAGEVDDAFSAFELQVAALAAATLLQEVDSGAARRLAEIDAYEALVDRGRAAGAPVSSAADRAATSDVTIPALEERLSVIRSDVIALQEWIESAPSAEAQAMEADVWQVLRDVNRIRQGL